MKKESILDIIVILFAILFLYTGVSKIIEYGVFKEQIATSPLLKLVASWLAWMLPLAELMVVILIFIPRLRLKGLYAALASMLLFTGYILYTLNSNDRLPCSCGGVLEVLSWKEHIILNSAFIVLALIGIFLIRQLSNFSHTKGRTLYYS